MSVLPLKPRAVASEPTSKVWRFADWVFGDLLPVIMEELNEVLAI